MTSLFSAHYPTISVSIYVIILMIPATSPTANYTLGVFVPLNAGPRQLGDASLEAVKWTVGKLNKDICASTHGIQFNYVIHDTKCDSQLGLFQFFKTVTSPPSDDRIDVVIGGACDDVCNIIGGLVGFVHLPMISYGCSSDSLSDRSQYTTFLRTSSNFSHMELLLEEYLKSHQWKRVTFVHLNDTYSWLDTADVFYDKLVHHGFEVRQLTIRDKTTLNDDLLKEAEHTRIFVICAYELSVVDFMERAVALGLDNGQYAFITLDFSNTYKINSNWTSNPALNGLVDIVIDVSPDRDIYRQFLQDVLRTTTIPSTSDLSESFELGIHWALLSDAIALYARAVCQCLDSGEDPNSTLCLTKHLYDVTFEGVTGSVVIEPGGNRVATLKLYNIQNGLYVPIGNFSSTQGLKLFSKAVWPGGHDVAPLGRPDCGWNGEECDEPDGMVAVYVLSGIIVGVTAVVCLYSSIKRRSTRRRVLASQWKIPYSDLVRPNLTSDGISTSWCSLDDIERGPSRCGSNDSMTITVEQRPNLYYYSGQVVYAKPIKKHYVAQSKHLTKEINDIRQLEHRNINQLLGACVEVNRILLITSYNSRGSLFDFLHPDIDHRPKLDVTFITSFASDIVKGMKYLHGSQVQYHGRLTSKNVFIDSHYTCKVGDFHMDYFREGEKDDEHSDDFLRRQFWSAPELLRTDVPVRNVNLPLASHQKADVYSFAIVLCEILTRNPPYYQDWDDPASVLDKIRNRDPTPGKLTRPILVPQVESAGASPALHNRHVSLRNSAFLESDQHLLRPHNGENHLLQEHRFRPSHAITTHDEQNAIPQLEDLVSLSWSEDPLLRPNFPYLLSRIKQFGKNNIVENLIHMLTKANENLEKRVEKKTHELKAERDKMKDLLHEMLPKTVAEQLVSLGGNTRPPPESFDCVTILFADVVGFTNLSNKLQPEEVFDLLNRVYQHFDAITRAHHVYKVETVGDAYMVASGLPDRHENHAEEIATLSLDILSQLRPSVFQLPQLKQGQPLQLRIGIHSGPVVAGIVGLKMPHYCVCGDTVNTASRLESSCMALRIHVSGSTAELLKRSGGYKLEKRGEVEMKGLAKMTTYWLWGKEGFDCPLPDISLAAPLSEHHFK